MKKNSRIQVFLMLNLLVLTGTAASLCLGAVPLTLGEIGRAISSGPDSPQGWIFWYARLPRTAACLLAGAALAASGCVIQSVLGNKLASPGIIGVNAGAGLAVTLCCAAGVLSGWAVAVSSFAGAMVSAMLVMYLARKTGASRTTVILAGVAVNSIFNAISEAIVTLIPEVGIMGSDFRVGGFSSVVHTRLIPAAVLILLALVILLTLCHELDVLALGEERAHSLGMSVKGVRSLFLILAAMLAGAAVSFSGLLGFVGLVVPHVGRKLVGSESKYLLPACMLGGAGFVTVCDLAARLLFVPYELPVGILMAVIGGPFFLFMLMKRKGGHRND